MIIQDHPIITQANFSEKPTSLLILARLCGHQRVRRVDIFKYLVHVLNRWIKYAANSCNKYFVTSTEGLSIKIAVTNCIQVLALTKKLPYEHEFSTGFNSAS